MIILLIQEFTRTLRILCQLLHANGKYLLMYQFDPCGLIFYRQLISKICQWP